MKTELDVILLVNPHESLHHLWGWGKSIIRSISFILYNEMYMKYMNILVLHELYVKGNGCRLKLISIDRGFFFFNCNRNFAI